LSRIRARTAIAIASVAIVVLASAAPVFAVTNRWAWVVARHASTAGYTPAALDQGSSESATNSVARSSVGRYVVTLGNQGAVAASGMVHASAMGSQANFCNVNGWGPSGADLTASVRCFDRTGSRTDSQFIVVFQMTNSNQGREAHVWADQPMNPIYQPNANYSYNSHAGQQNWVTRASVGKYTVSFGGLGSTKGSVQVSAYGDHRVACRASRWYDNGTNEWVIVLCRDPLGHLVDSRFDVTFVQSQGLKGQFGGPAAYLWANRPTVASYHPDPAYRWSAPRARSTVSRTNVGVYSVKLPSMPLGGAALVTPTGTGKARCVIASIRISAAPQRVGVRCFNIAGAPADAPFALAYLK